MGKKRTTTVTHPDGTVSTRKSETRTYTHAVEVGPAPAEAMAAYLDRQAAKLDAAATALREAAEAARVTIQDRRLGGNARDLITHVAKLAGTDVYTWCSADGRTNSYREGADGAVVDVAPYLRDCARDNAAAREDGAAKNRSEAAAIRAAGVPVGSWDVVRWSSRADLAHAATKEFDHLAAQGRPVRAVAVDAPQGETPTAAPSEAPADPYAKRPRVGEHIDTGRYGVCRVLKVHGNGERLTVADRLGREWPVERESAGYWLRADAPAAAETTPAAEPFVSGWSALVEDGK
jgi:hypothetical protein